MAKCNIGNIALSLMYKYWYLEIGVLVKSAELVKRCLTGDRLSYKELYLRYAKAMYNTCVRILANEIEAEDILQESFTEAFKNLIFLERPDGFGVWLKQICINRCINKLKSQKIKWLDVETVPDLAEEINDDRNIELKVESIKKAVMKLAPGYRTVLTLYLFEGYDHEEISEILKVAPSTTRTQYVRARQRLLDILKYENER